MALIKRDVPACVCASVLYFVCARVYIFVCVSVCV